MATMAPDTAAEMAAIAERHSTISGKIRALGAAGYARADIARFLGRSYQQVRQVLVAEETRRDRQKADVASSNPGPNSAEMSQPSVGETPISAAPAVFRMVVEPDGRLAVPAVALATMNVQPGDVVIGRIEGNELVLSDGQTAMRRVQEMVRSLIPGEDSLADELIADRRREAESDDGRS